MAAKIPNSRRDRAVFVDASAFFAVLDSREVTHSAADTIFRQLANERRELVTSNLVVAETHALMIRRLGRRVAWNWLRDLDLNFVFASNVDHRDALAILASYSDKDFSYADAVSFVMMERLGIPTAFTFDEHFRQYGVAVLP